MRPPNMRGGILVQYVLVRSWIVSITLTPQKRGRIFKCGDCSIEKHHKKRPRRRSRGPASVWLAAPQRECQPTPDATQLQQDVQDLSTHFTAIIHEKNRRSAAPDAHISPAWYLQESLELFSACEEQSRFLFSGLISIKPCCWLGTLRTVFENQYRMKIG